MVNNRSEVHSSGSGTSKLKSTAAKTPDRSQLADLYPQPKSYEQREVDVKLRQLAYRRNWPKRPYVNIAAYGSIVFGFLIWFSQNLGSWWFGSTDKGVVMATVFLTFAIALAIWGLIIAWVKYVNGQFDYFGGSTRFFWLIQSVLIPVLIAIWLSGFAWEYTSILWIPALVVISFLTLLFSASRTIGKR